MNIEQLLKDYNIQIADPSDKHYKEGWLNINCPFCNSHKKHLGIHIKNLYGNCWQCGFHSIFDIIKHTTGKSTSEVLTLLKTIHHNHNYSKPKKVAKDVPKATELLLPSNIQPLFSHHAKYLRKRCFDTNYLEDFWGIKSTGPTSTVNGIDYRNRIFCPIYWNGELVSYQCRTISNFETVKYKTAAPEYEKVFHKDILYGKQEMWGNTIIVVEGITDAWALKGYGVATFGIEYSKKQLLLLASNFKVVYIMYDNDKAGNLAGVKMKNELDFLGVENHRIVPESDPGDMCEKEVNKLLRRIL